MYNVIIVHAAQSGVILTRTVREGWSIIRDSSSIDFEERTSVDRFGKVTLDWTDDTDVDADKQGVSALEGRLCWKKRAMCRIERELPLFLLRSVLLFPATIRNKVEADRE